MNEKQNKTSSVGLSWLPYIFWRAAVSMLLLWLAFPPIGLSVLGWVALIPLFQVVADDRVMPKGGLWKIWWAGLFYWLATFYFVPLPHPALWAGWVVLSIYLACYLPVFMIASRTLIHRLKIPSVVAIPICWTGLEFIRCHLFTGMGLVCLSHTQYQFPLLIQVSDIFGAYTLTFAMAVVSVGGCTLMLANTKMAVKVVNLVVAVAVLAGVYVYGTAKLQLEPEPTFGPIAVALLQGSVDTVFPSTVEEAQQFAQTKNEHYRQLHHEAIGKWSDLDVVLWPENGWPFPDLHPDTDTAAMPPEDRRLYQDTADYAMASLMVPTRNSAAIITGSLTVNPVSGERFGSAVYYDEFGNVVDHYYKNHLVMFGEYVPLTKVFPLLRRISPIGEGLQAGTESANFVVNGVKLAPNICFESTVPHFIRGQVQQLKSQQQEPDVLVNLTNDGWFYGTSCLDFHLACNVFRAVEMRKPVLVCANTGFSAHVNERGQILRQGPRRQSEMLLLTVTGTHWDSPYLAIGDWIPLVMASICMFSWVLGVFLNRRTKTKIGRTPVEVQS